MYIPQQIYPHKIHSITDAIWDNIDKSVSDELSGALIYRDGFRNIDWIGSNPLIRRIITQELINYEYSY